MRAPGKRIKIYKGGTIPAISLYNFIACRCRVALHIIHYLHGAVAVIGAKRQTYCSAVGLHHSVKQGHITLFHLTPGKCRLQQPMSHPVAGKQHDARSIHVQPVYCHKVSKAGKTLFQQFEQRFPAITPRHGGYPGRLVNCHNPLIFINDFQITAFNAGACIRRVDFNIKAL